MVKLIRANLDCTSSKALKDKRPHPPTPVKPVPPIPIIWKRSMMGTRYNRVKPRTTVWLLSLLCLLRGKLLTGKFRLIIIITITFPPPTQSTSFHPLNFHSHSHISYLPLPSPFLCAPIQLFLTLPLPDYEQTIGHPSTPYSLHVVLFPPISCLVQGNLTFYLVKLKQSGK